MGSHSRFKDRVGRDILGEASSELADSYTNPTRKQGCLELLYRVEWPSAFQRNAIRLQSASRTCRSSESARFFRASSGGPPVCLPSCTHVAYRRAANILAQSLWQQQPAPAEFSDCRGPIA
jgi:hypothetical protein